jgi:hypothetical protein
MVSRSTCIQLFEDVVEQYGMKMLGWRDVPTNEKFVGPTPRKTEPKIRQAFVTPAETFYNRGDFDRRLYLVRQRIENLLEFGDHTDMVREGFYINALSANRIIYKGMLTAEQLHVVLLDDLLEHADANRPADHVLRQEDLRDAVLPELRQGDALLLHLPAEELVGQADEDARAVAAVGLAAAGAAVVHPLEHRQRVVDDLVRRLPFDVADEPDAARVVLVLGQVKTLSGRVTDGIAAAIGHGNVRNLSGKSGGDSIRNSRVVATALSLGQQQSKFIGCLKNRRVSAAACSLGGAAKAVAGAAECPSTAIVAGVVRRG